MDKLEDVDPRVMAPFSKTDARMVAAANYVVHRIRAGIRASEAIEWGLQSEHLVAVPMLDLETDETTLLVTKDWRVPFERQGQFRTLVEYMRFGYEWRDSPEVIIGKAEAWKLQQQATGMRH